MLLSSPLHLGGIIEHTKVATNFNRRKFHTQRDPCLSTICPYLANKSDRAKTHTFSTPEQASRTLGLISGEYEIEPASGPQPGRATKNAITAVLSGGLQ